jgi:diketogulonate reductase-like aldo/keto reductase
VPLPVAGPGGLEVPNGSDCVQAVRCALEPGYRHIDIAQAYGNGQSVGRALRESGAQRDQAHEIDEVVAAAQVRPAGNQIQLSPFETRRALLEQCRTLGIVPEAHSPLGTDKYLVGPTRRAKANGGEP